MVYGCCACQHLISLRSHCWNKFRGPISGPLQGCRAESPGMRRCLMTMPRVFFPASDFATSRKNPLEPDSSSLYHISWHLFLFTSRLLCEVPDLSLNSVAVDLRTTWGPHLQPSGNILPVEGFHGFDHLLLGAETGLGADRSPTPMPEKSTTRSSEEQLECRRCGAMIIHLNPKP
jgi:hypothetical protein